VSTEPRTVTLATCDAGDVILPEPSWCRGHADHRPDTHRVDLDHKGVEHRLTHNGALLWTMFIGQTPYASRPEHRSPGVYVAQEGYAETHTRIALYDLAAALDAHADQMRALADELAAEWGEGQ
jgi:hypothetical protein